MPALLDASGRLLIGPGFDGEVSAPLVTEAATGRVRGVYIDDSTPNIDYWIAKAVAKYPDGLVVVSVPMGRPNMRYGPRPPVLNCHEWYPYGSPGDWGSFPTRRAGYVVQRHYGGYGVESGAAPHPPTYLQYLRLLARARLQRPKLILTF